ncbi:MAG: hypothetical protein AAGM38_05570 [Pseudomonadota bacterium]
MKDYNRESGFDYEELQRRRAEAMASIEAKRLQAESRGAALGLLAEGFQALEKARFFGFLIKIAPSLCLLMVIGGLSLHFAAG